MQQSPRRHPRLAGPSAMRADESVRPAQASDILAASSVAAEPLVNFLKGPWVINPRDKVTGVLHPPRLPSGPTGVKRIPYYLEWHMRQRLAPMLFDDADPDEAEARRRSVVAPAQRSKTAIKKQTTSMTPDGLPVHSFHTLLADLATLARNTIITAINPRYPLTVVTRPTPVQQKAFDLLGLAV